LGWQVSPDTISRRIGSAPGQLPRPKLVPNLGLPDRQNQG
jgi:hypothetical protein